MNINVYDNINSTFPKKRENYVRRAADTMTRPDYNGDMPAFPASTPLAMAYVPFQRWGDTMSPEDALECGTLFNDLVFPFNRGGAKR